MWEINTSWVCRLDQDPEIYWNLVKCIRSVMSTLCDPMDCSPPGSSLHRILQARVLQWVAISFSRNREKHEFNTTEEKQRMYILKQKWLCERAIVTVIRKWGLSFIQHIVLQSECLLNIGFSYLQMFS